MNVIFPFSYLSLYNANHTKIVCNENKIYGEFLLQLGLDKDEVFFSYKTELFTFT